MTQSMLPAGVLRASMCILSGPSSVVNDNDYPKCNDITTLM